jgi:hypothetical protein
MAKQKKNTLKSNVISFRLTTPQAKLLRELFDRDPPSYVTSDRAFARKIVCDFLANRLKYNDPAHRLLDVDAHAASGNGNGN